MSVVTRIRTSQELVVPFMPEAVWEVLADVAAYPDWWPAELAVEVLHHPGGLLGAEFEVRPFMGRMFRIRFEEIEGLQSMRLRFFGGALEGPGGFHLLALEGATQVRYEMDVFARGLDVAVLSQLLPPDSIHRLRMRRVLRSLARRLESLGKAEEGKAASPPASNLDIARRYIEALSSRAPASEIGQFFAPEANHEDGAHRFSEDAVTRGFDGILEARTRSLARFSWERYEFAGAVASGSQVAMEVRWTGSVAEAGEGFTEGEELGARIAFFLEFEDGKIVRQRTYGCAPRSLPPRG